MGLTYAWGVSAMTHVRTLLESGSKIFLALLATALVFTLGVQSAQAGAGTPANKVVAAASKRQVVAPGTNVTLMTATMKTSKPTDVMLDRHGVHHPHRSRYQQR